MSVGGTRAAAQPRGSHCAREIPENTGNIPNWKGPGCPRSCAPAGGRAREGGRSQVQTRWSAHDNGRSFFPLQLKHLSLPGPTLQPPRSREGNKGLSSRSVLGKGTIKPGYSTVTSQQELRKKSQGRAGTSSWTSFLKLRASPQSNPPIHKSRWCPTLTECLEL